ncbi:hypothetical protein Tco_0963309, partial [Tanacetum coccineum]
MLKTVERGIEQKLKDVIVVVSGNYNKSGYKWKGKRGKRDKNDSSKKAFKGHKPKK